MTSFVLSTGISTFISTAVLIWSIVSMWIIFKKAGRKGWEAIIPVWNVYVLFKIIGKTRRFWIMLLGLPLIGVIWLVCSLIFFFLRTSGELSEGIITIKNLINRLLGLASFIFMIITIVLTIMARCRLAKKFGKSGGFAVGLIFLTPIFLGILAFSGATYEGVEFDEKYSWKKWLFITLGIALVIGCCKAGLEYKFYKDFYELYDFDYDYEVIDEKDESGNGDGLGTISDKISAFENSESNIQDFTEWMDESGFEELYPELAEILKNSKDEDEYDENLGYSVSAIFLNRNTVSRYIEDVKQGKQTGNIEYHIEFIEEILNELKHSDYYNNPAYKAFYEGERSKLSAIKIEAKEVIGDKKRGDMGIYE